MKKIVCGIVIFMPTKDVLYRIKMYSQVFEQVFVYDNTPNNISENIRERISQIAPNISIYSNKKNDGLSKAYNYFIEKSKLNFDYLCILDQDSFFNKNDIQKIFSFLNINNTEQIAVLGPTIIYNSSTSNKESEKISLVDRRYIISSGSFINLKIIEENKGLRFDNNYFIDRVDTDFCTECIKEGFRVCQLRGTYLYQTLGEENKTKNSFQHSTIRHYYMFRNRFYYNLKYHGRTIGFCFSFVQSIKQCLRIILYENKKQEKLKQLIVGYIDYEKGHMGKGRY